MTTPERPSEPAALTLELDGAWPPDDLRRVREGVARGIRSGRAVQVDLSRVDQLTSGIVASILWARRSCALGNLGFSVVGDHGPTRRVLRSCGVVAQDRGSGAC